MKRENQMQKKNVFAGLIAVGLMAAIPNVYAASGLMKACKADLKKAGCKATTDAEAHECLEQKEVHGKKDDGFSHACYEAHEAYEKSAGKEEKSEAEHKE